MSFIERETFTASWKPAEASLKTALDITADAFKRLTYREAIDRFASQAGHALDGADDFTEEFREAISRSSPAPWLRRRRESNQR